MDVAQAFQGTTKKHDVPLDHLDFGYIRDCSDIKHLEKILRVLRSKEEGFYPDLEKCCEERLTVLSPNSRLLRKESPLYSKGDLASQEREELDQDLKSWTSQMRNIESNIGGGDFDDMDTEADELPPIRSGNITLSADGVKSNKSQQTNPNKRVMPREYRDWDKINVDEELKKVDEDDNKGKERTFIANREVTNIPDKIDAKGLSDGEKLLKANREKDKGNEAFRSNDFKEAVTYYSRSISLQPTAASYNNRALAYLKMSDWQKAISDTNTVLDLEPDNVKALLRRGTAYKGQKQLQKARKDIESALKLEPNNPKAKELLEQIEKDKQEKKKKGRRMVIEDVEGEENAENPSDSSKGGNSNPESPELESKQRVGYLENTYSEKPTEKSSRRMQIVEVDSESEEEEAESENKDDRLVNGHASEVEMNISEVNKNEENSENKETEQNPKEEKEEEKISKIKDNLSENTESVPEASNSEGSTSENQMTEEVKTSSKETLDDRSSPVEAEEERSDSEEVEDKETSEVESSETEIVEPVEDFKRPVFYMKELPKNAVAVKEEATTLFKSGQYGEACQKYSKLISMLENDESQTVNLSLMYSNRAACHLKTGDLPGTVKDCSASLDLIPHSVKPLLRRAIAFEHLERYRPAYVDYRHVLLIDSRMDQAHQGTKRCQHMLSQKDGPRWREKVHLPKISPFQIPDIIGLDGNSTSPAVFSNPPASSQSQLTCTSGSQSQLSITQGTSKPSITQGTPSPSEKDTEQVNKDTKIEKEEIKEETKQANLSPQEQFDTLKAEGNEFVKQSKFKEAIECYDKCETVFPGQVAIYTNRALCYIRTNQAKKAEEDCSKALTFEKENVKALFRRAQARKMLKQYRDGIEDLKHLLQVDPKNSAAKKEMELLKNYWREELENMKKNLTDLKSKKDDLTEQTSGNAGSQSSAQSGKQSGKQAGKQRKRMVIQEVDSDEENKPKGASKASSKDTKPKVEEISTESSKTKPVTKSAKEPKGSSQTGSSKKGSKTSQKSAIKESSQGLPSAPKVAPKLDKATPYEFISAWNALKKSETVQPYYDLLKQIKPSDIKNVISNKLDGAMLNNILRCVAEHYLPNGEGDVSYQLLKNLSTVPRFGTVCMFLSQKDKSEVLSVMNKLESLPSKTYTQGDISKLRKQYIG